MNRLVCKTIDLRQGEPNGKREEILSYFLKTWEVDEKLYSVLKRDETFYMRGDPLRHILLFYLGHTAAFFVNKLFLAKIISARINPVFESLFAIGVDEMSWDDLNNRHYDWPEVDAVRAYRDEVKVLVVRLISELTLAMPIGWESPFWLIMMGIEHERIHLETSSVLIRQLPLEEVRSGVFGVLCASRGDAPRNELLPVPGGVVTMGKKVDSPLYGWDNEYGQYSEEVTGFQASKFLISNGEYLAFVEEKGYETERYWTEEGWRWRNFRQSIMPLFWRKENGVYRLRLMAEEIDMPWNWPVEVNYLEAKAYCNYRKEKSGKPFRLPTEAEWVRIAEHCNVPDQLAWTVAPGNINLEHFASPCPVDQFAFGDFFDILGNVWQWTETPITGFPGFKVHPMYDDFSTPTFDGKHNLIKGGSWISTGNEATLQSRYAFRRHFYQHAGFRIVESDVEPVIHEDAYETDAEVTLACEADWGELAGQNGLLMQRLAAIAKECMRNREQKNVLDLNSNTGRLAFEMAQWADRVTALDFSARFVRMAVGMQERGFIRYQIKDEGDLLIYRDVLLTDFGLESGRDKILFMQDNADNIKPIYTGYDLIVASHLLEELINPVAFLEKIADRLNPEGVLVIASAYEWLDERSAVENRPGGFKRDGEPVTSFEGIKEILEKNFLPVGDVENVPLIRRISSRRQEVLTSEISVWKKRLP